MSQHRYPHIGIRSKNELAKRISSHRLPHDKALALINDVLKNSDRYWYDAKSSQPEKQKFVRSAKKSPLGKLLKLIDRRVLAPYDKLVPHFVFGGLSGKSHIQAAYHLLGEKRSRTLLGLDVGRFFEQIKERRVFYFFYAKCGCSKEAAKLFARLCCVPLGPKHKPEEEKSLARGFATSTRLALWCNLDLFIRISWAAGKHFKGHNPRIAIFIDDIGITASRVNKGSVEQFAAIVDDMLKNFDPNQPLPANATKTHIAQPGDYVQHLGLNLGRNKITMGNKTLKKKAAVLQKLRESPSIEERKKLLKQKKSYYVYKKAIIAGRL